MIFFQEEMLYVAQKLINLKETKDDGKAGADLQYTNQLINCISLDPKYIQNGWDLNMRLRMEYPEIDDIQNIINSMPLDNAKVLNAQEIIVEILKLDRWGIMAHVLIKHGIIKEIKEVIKDQSKCNQGFCRNSVYIN